METYQDLSRIRDNETERMAFIKRAVRHHQESVIYKNAYIAQEYDAHRNITINKYRKFLYNLSGKAVPDNYSANYKLGSNFFHIFTTQTVQHLLGNGATWQNDDTKNKLGNDFNKQLVNAGKLALIGGESFGFWNFDHLEVFSILEFVPLYDEDTGALMAGIRFWQVDHTKPFRATLYELDGYTEYIWRDGTASVLAEKAPYITVISETGMGEKEILDGKNYPSFPIVPLFANEYKQSTIVGLQEGIDCYDLIKSGFADDIDDASQIYWILQNAGGMGNLDLAKFVERIRTVRAVNLDDGVSAEAHTMEVPYASREAILDRISKDLYRDAMALNVQDIISGASTATQIRAAYENLDAKCDEFEIRVKDFIRRVLDLTEIDDTPTFTRSYIVNRSEEIQTVVSAGTFLSSDYVVTKILTLLGDADKVDDVREQLIGDTASRFSVGTEDASGA